MTSGHELDDRVLTVGIRVPALLEVAAVSLGAHLNVFKRIMSHLVGDGAGDQPAQFECGVDVGCGIWRSNRHRRGRVSDKDAIEVLSQEPVVRRIEADGVAPGGQPSDFVGAVTGVAALIIGSIAVLGADLNVSKRVA